MSSSPNRVSSTPWFELKQVRTDELMDDPNIDSAVHAKALAGLARLNKTGNAAGCLWQEISAIARRTLNRPVRVLEIASGGGDILFDLARRAKSSGLNIQFTGSDRSTTAIALARQKFTAELPETTFLKIDALNDHYPTGFDIVMTSLFTHHLDREQVVTLLEKMNVASIESVLVSDLERSKLNLALVWIATRAVTTSEIVHYDGPVSVKAAYTATEFLDLAREASLSNPAVRQVFPCRFLLSSRRSSATTN